MATYYISPTGNDTTGDGSTGNPWATVNKAITSSVAGDTIVCKDGTYSGTGNNDLNRTSITRTIQAQNNGKAIFDAAGGGSYWVIAGNSIVSVIGLTFQNVVTNNFNLFWLTTGINSFTFTNCIFSNVKNGVVNYGMFTYEAAGETFSFTNCQFNNIGATVQSSAYPMFLFGNTGETLNMTNCTINFGYSGTSALTHILKSGSVTVTLKNTIVNNATGGTITYNSGATITEQSTYDCFFNITGSPAGTGVITSDPLFVDASNANFKLRPTSPCLGTGSL